MSPIHASRSLWTSAAAGYTGPGDVVPGAAAWWGLRAYTSASIGINAVRLREDGGNTEQDFPTIAGGGLNLAAIAAFKGANNLFVVTLYDQTGNALHQTQSVAGNQPGLLLSGLGSLPTLTFDGVGQNMQSPSDTFTANLTTVSAVANETNTGGQQCIVIFGGNSVQLGYNNAGANTVFAYAGNVLSATASDGSWHALQAVFDSGSNADMNVDGGSTTGNVGGGGANGNYILGRVGAGQFLQGSLTELGVWKSIFSSGNCTAMSANQHAYWGF